MVGVGVVPAGGRGRLGDPGPEADHPLDAGAGREQPGGSAVRGSSARAAAGPCRPPAPPARGGDRPTRGCGGRAGWSRSGRTAASARRRRPPPRRAGAGHRRRLPVVHPGADKCLELGGVLAGQDGLVGAEAVREAVEGGVVLAGGRLRAGGLLGITAVGGDLRFVAIGGGPLGAMRLRWAHPDVGRTLSPRGYLRKKRAGRSGGPRKRCQADPRDVKPP